MKNLKEAFKKLMHEKREKIKKGKLIIIDDINRIAKHEFECKDFVEMEQSNNPEKYFIFERLERVSINGIPYNKKLKKGDIEYRISYYIVSRKNPENLKHYGKWRHGQNSLMIPSNDFTKLIELAKTKKVLL